MPEKTRKDKNLIPKAKVIIGIFMNGCEYFNQVSVFYSQDKWLKEIKRICGREIKRRQLNYDFAGLRKMGIIKTYSRHRPDEIRGYEFRSTRFYIAAVGWRMAANWGVISWKKAFKMIAAIKNGGQYKSPKKSPVVRDNSLGVRIAQKTNELWAKEIEACRERVKRLNNAPLPNE